MSQLTYELLDQPLRFGAFFFLQAYSQLRLIAGSEDALGLPFFGVVVMVFDEGAKPYFFELGSLFRFAAFRVSP